MKLELFIHGLWDTVCMVWGYAKFQVVECCEIVSLFMTPRSFYTVLIHTKLGSKTGALMLAPNPHYVS